jgi:transcriptional regulator with XRE-family HTH domain
MPKPIGPTIPRWRLGEQLAALRDRAGLSQAAIATRLGCSISKIQKIEAGDVGVVRAELLLMLEAYGVSDESLRERLTELQRLGKERGWWSRFGQLPVPLTTFLGLESAATGIRVFEPLMVPGLLQTRAYARALAAAEDGAAMPDDLDRHVEILMERQRQVLEADPPTIQVILDEAVLRRPVGGPAVMAAQLDRLADAAEQVTLRIVPLAAGGYPGLRGGFTLFEFDRRLHSPVGYVESRAGSQYVEKEADLRRCEAAFESIAAVALGEAESARLIRTYLP